MSEMGLPKQIADIDSTANECISPEVVQVRKEEGQANAAPCTPGLKRSIQNSEAAVEAEAKVEAEIAEVGEKKAPKKKKKKKKKKGSSYKNFLKSAMKSSSPEKKREQYRQKIQATMGGGKFNKMIDKL